MEEKSFAPVMQHNIPGHEVVFFNWNKITTVLYKMTPFLLISYHVTGVPYKAYKHTITSQLSVRVDGESGSTQEDTQIYSILP